MADKITTDQMVTLHKLASRDANTIASIDPKEVSALAELAGLDEKETKLLHNTKRIKELQEKEAKLDKNGNHVALSSSEQQDVALLDSGSFKLDNAAVQGVWQNPGTQRLESADEVRRYLLSGDHTERYINFVSHNVDKWLDEGKQIYVHNGKDGGLAVVTDGNGNPDMAVYNEYQENMRFGGKNGPIQDVEEARRILKADIALKELSSGMSIPAGVSTEQWRDIRSGGGKDLHRVLDNLDSMYQAGERLSLTNGHIDTDNYHGWKSENQLKDAATAQNWLAAKARDGNDAEKVAWKPLADYSGLVRGYYESPGAVPLTVDADGKLDVTNMVNWSRNQGGYEKYSTGKATDGDKTDLNQALTGLREQGLVVDRALPEKVPAPAQAAPAAPVLKQSITVNYNGTVSNFNLGADGTYVPADPAPAAPAPAVTTTPAPAAATPPAAPADPAASGTPAPAAATATPAAPAATDPAAANMSKVLVPLDVVKGDDKNVTLSGGTVVIENKHYALSYNGTSDGKTVTINGATLTDEAGNKTAIDNQQLAKAFGKNASSEITYNIDNSNHVNIQQDVLQATSANTYVNVQAAAAAAAAAPAASAATTAADEKKKKDKNIFVDEKKGNVLEDNKFAIGAGLLGLMAGLLLGGGGLMGLLIGLLIAAVAVFAGGMADKNGFMHQHGGTTVTPPGQGQGLSTDAPGTGIAPLNPAADQTPPAPVPAKVVDADNKGLDTVTLNDKDGKALSQVTGQLSADGTSYVITKVAAIGDDGKPGTATTLDKPIVLPVKDGSIDAAASPDLMKALTPASDDKAAKTYKLSDDLQVTGTIGDDGKLQITGGTLKGAAFDVSAKPISVDMLNGAPDPKSIPAITAAVQASQSSASVDTKPPAFVGPIPPISPDITNGNAKLLDDKGQPIKAAADGTQSIVVGEFSFTGKVNGNNFEISRASGPAGDWAFSKPVSVAMNDAKEVNFGNLVKETGAAITAGKDVQVLATRTPKNPMEDFQVVAPKTQDKDPSLQAFQNFLKTQPPVGGIINENDPTKFSLGNLSSNIAFAANKPDERQK